MRIPFDDYGSSCDKVTLSLTSRIKLYNGINVDPLNGLSVAKAFCWVYSPLFSLWFVVIQVCQKGDVVPSGAVVISYVIRTHLVIDGREKLMCFADYQIKGHLESLKAWSYRPDCSIQIGKRSFQIVQISELFVVLASVELPFNLVKSGAL